MKKAYNKNSNLIILSLLLTLSFFPTLVHPLTWADSTPQACNPHIKQEFTTFYSKHILTYDLILPPSILDSFDCQYLIIQKNKIPLMLIWMELPLRLGVPDYKSPDSNLCLLMLSKNPKSNKVTFTEDNSIPNFEFSCNQMIQDESQFERLERLKTFIRPELVHSVKNFDPSLYTEEAELFYVAKLFGFGNVCDFLISMIIGEEFSLHSPFLTTYFRNAISHTLALSVEQEIRHIRSLMNKSFDTRFESVMFGKISDNSNYFRKQYKKVLMILNAMVNLVSPSSKKDSTNFISAVINMFHNQLNVSSLIQLLDKYFQTFPEKQQAWNKLSSTFQEKNYYVLNFQKNILEYLTSLDLDNLKFLILESFTQKGYVYKPKSASLKTKFSYKIAKDNCNLHEQDKLRLINLAIEMKWLSPELFYTTSITEIYRKCFLSSQGEDEGEHFLSIIVNPTNKEKCEFVVRQTQVDGQEPQEEIVSDTNGIYWLGLSCYRHTQTVLRKGEMFLKAKDKLDSNGLRRSFISNHYNEHSIVGMKGHLILYI